MVSIPPGAAAFLATAGEKLTGFKEKIGSGLANLKSKIPFIGGGSAAGGEGASAGSAGGSNAKGLTGLIENFLQDGRINGLTPLQWVLRIGIQITILAFIVGAIFLLFVGSTASDIFTGVFNLGGNLKEGAEELSEGYLNILYGASGESYASEVDSNSDTDIGINILESETSQSVYAVADPVTIWTKINAKPFSGNSDPLNLMVKCWHENGGVVTEGYINGQTEQGKREFVVTDEINLDLRCDFEEGVLNPEWVDVSASFSAANTFIISAEFNFLTKAYVRKYFIDGDTYRASKEKLITEFPEMIVPPVSKNTQGPIQLGIGTDENPVEIYDQESSVDRTFIKISIDNTWNGAPKKIKGFDILLPKGIFLEQDSCDASIYFDEAETQDLEGYTRYSMLPESVEFISKKMTSVDWQEIAIHNVKCFINFEPDIIYDGREKSLPVVADLISEISYDYELQYQHLISVGENYEGAITTVSPSRVGINSEFLCSAKRIEGAHYSNAEFTLTHRKPGQPNSEATVVPGFNGAYASCPNDECIYSVNLATISAANNIEVDDYLACKFLILLDNGETTSVTKLIKILNVPPEVKSVSFDKNSYSENQDVTCISKIEDLEASNNLDVQFSFNNNGIIRVVRGEDVYCSGYSGNSITCSASMTSDFYDAGDRVTCTVFVKDGSVSSNEHLFSSTVISEIPEGVDVTQSVECTDSDGGVTLNSRGTTEGANGQGVVVSRVDTCNTDVLIEEYYCLDNVLMSGLYYCEHACLNGACS